MTEKSVCSSILQSADIFVEQAKALNFETDLNYFLNEFSASFHPPSEFQFLQFEGNEVRVCVCVCVCMCVCMYMCVYMRLCVLVCMCVYRCCVCVYRCCVCVCVCACTCVCTCVYV